MKKIVLVFIFVVNFASTMFACSFNAFVPFEYNPKEFVFLGSVVGYTDKIETDFVSYNRNIKFTGFGIKIKIDSVINLPQESEIVEVFRTYPRDTACAPRGVSLEELKKDFPVGTQVRVIGQENSKLLGVSANNNPRIEVSGGNQGQLFNNIGKKGKFFTTADSVFDYKLSLPLYDSRFSTAETFVWLFEIRKDLKRLEQPGDQLNRFEILKRLAFAYDNYQDYGKLIQKYLQDKSQIEVLLKLKNNWEKKRFSLIK